MNYIVRSLIVYAPLMLCVGCMSAGNDLAGRAPSYGNNNGGQVLADNPYNDPYGSPYGTSAFRSAASLPSPVGAQARQYGYRASSAQGFSGYDASSSRAAEPDTGFFSWAKNKVKKKILGNSERPLQSWFKERMTPRPLKRQLFGTPNGVNQFGEGQNEQEAMREVRNGTRKIRMKQRAEYGRNAYAQNVGQYASQYDAPKPGGSSYGQGFEDGCKTFMSAVGSGVWRLLDHKRIDVQRYVKDNWYLRGYNDGADFCTSRTDWDMH